MSDLTVKSTAGAVTAGFGAALAGLSGAAPAEAAVVGLSFSPGSVAYSGGGLEFVSMSTTAASGFVTTFTLYNDGFGRTLLPFNSTGMLVRPVTSNETISPTDSFSGNNSFTTGTQTFGFQTAGGDVGWLRLIIAAGGPVVFEGAIETMGGDILAGQAPDPGTDVPLPATLPMAALGTLALGAIGIRRRRKAAA